MGFDLWFPTAILQDTIDDYENINKNLIEHIEGIQKTVPSGGYNWIGRPYNTCGTFNIIEDPAFDLITQKVSQKVRDYAGRLGINPNKHQFKCTEAWINIYDKKDFQEYHYHAGHKFSAVYYVQAPADSSEIVFESPLLPDMDPLPVTLHSSLTDERARYKSVPGHVIVFRSNLKHCVPAHSGDEKRISLAFNFN